MIIVLVIVMFHVHYHNDNPPCVLYTKLMAYLVILRLTYDYNVIVNHVLSTLYNVLQDMHHVLCALHTKCMLYFIIKQTVDLLCCICLHNI